MTFNDIIKKDFIKEICGGMNPLQISEFIILCALFFIYPMSWKLSLDILAILMTNVIIRMIRYRKFGNNFSKLNRGGLILFIVLFVLYLISVTYSSDRKEAWDVVVRMLSLVAIPLYFLLTDVSFLKREQLRFMGYIFSYACLIMFIIMIGIDIWNIAFNGASANIIFAGKRIFIEHHTYSAMYFLLAIVFLFHDIVKYKEQSFRVLNIISIILFCFAIYFIQSRSGILLLYVLLTFFVIRLMFFKHKWLFGILSIVLIFCTFGSLNYLHQDRTYRTSKEIVGDNSKDMRFYIWESSFKILKEHPIFGVGAGDRISQMKKNIEPIMKSKKVEYYECNPHNQYLDVWLSVGILGVLTLITALLLFAFDAIKRKPINWLMLFFLLIIGFTLGFESIFMQQKGLVFCMFGLGLLSILSSQEEYFVNDKKV